MKSPGYFARRKSSWTIGCLFLLGCGDDTKPSNDAEVQAETAAETTSEIAAEADATAISGDVAGRWAMLETQTALATTEILGTQVQTSISYYLADFADGQLSVTLCDWLTTDTAGLTTTRMGDRVLASLTPYIRDYTVSVAGSGFALDVQASPTLRGVELDAPATDPMPTDGSDPRVIDQDGDGKPGITLVVQGTITGTLFVAHRHVAALAGTFESDARISGLTSWTTDQVIFGSEPPLIAAQKPVAVTHPDPDKSHFAMVKVADNDDCAAINAARAQLFP